MFKMSIVTVTLNHRELLECTMLSVINQTYSNIEYIIVDGGSTDHSIELIKKNESHITKWITEKDEGIYDAMNKGARLASGDYLCFLNSGDMLVSDNTIEQVVKDIASGKDASIFYGNICVKNSENALKEKKASEPTNKQRMFFCHQSAFVSIKWLQKYPFDTRYKMSADLKFFKQCFYADCVFKHLDYPIVIYDRSGISHRNRNAGLRENVAVIKEMDHGISRLLFLFLLYIVLYWRMLNNKS